MVGISVTGVLDEKVLVLNRLYTAVRVISARRAFTLLCKQIAEVIAVEDGRYVNYNFESWTEIADLQRQFEPDAHDWIRTPRLQIAVPKIIRLLGYDRLPQQEVKLNRRNLYARDRPRAGRTLWRCQRPYRALCRNPACSRRRDNRANRRNCGSGLG